ncbi:MAG: sigma-54 interaction domain-containing protein [Planctomycetota bacterium JB042]
MSGGLDQDLEELAARAAAIVREHGAKGADGVREVLERALETAGTDATAGTAGREAAAGPVDRSRYAEIIGESPAMLEVFALLDKVAASNIPVLIQGESGTGKELIASAIHRNSPRSAKPFVTENCAAIPETLQESELFGYKRGAFTGADRDRPGLFRVADGGTLFLDEVGDMSLAMQKKLLRALQDGEIRPVGGTKSIHVDVRVVSASNRLLPDLVAKKQFREDLFYRLNGVTIRLPPLRERAEDVPALASFFLARVAKEMGREAPGLAADARAALKRYAWPGNIRELENEVRRCLALLGGDATITAAHLSDEVRSGGA